MKNELNQQKEHWNSGKVDKRRKATHEVIRTFAQNKIAEVAKMIDFQQVETGLDIGCGNGYFTYYLQDVCDITGGDFSERILANNPVEKVARVDVCDIQFANNSYDLVFAANLLHHVVDLEKAVSEMARVCSKYVVIIEPSLYNPLFLGLCTLSKYERLALKNRPSKIIKCAQASGLKLLDSYCHGTVLPNVTPLAALNILKMFDRRFFLGLYRILIFEK